MPTGDVYLVFLETAGNQRYIFDTNKLRENVGASHLTWLAGTRWVLEAVTAATGNPLWTDDTNRLRKNLLKEELNPPIESAGCRVEVLLATSGKALLLVKEREVGVQIVRSVTERALREAPGLDLTGVISDAFNWGNNGSLARANAEVHGRYEAVRTELSPVEARFQRLPPMAECESSGLPAAGWRKEGESLRLKSAASMAKFDAGRDGQRRIASLAQQGGRVRLPDMARLDKTLVSSWIAVVHADGNGLGAVFQDFGAASMAQNNREYASRLREFSLAIDDCGEKALVKALEHVSTLDPHKREKTATVVPLVFGGDDLTVLCDGCIARELTESYLISFQMLTANCQEITQINGLEGGLRSCAGISFVKSHYPFHTAYTLAEELLVSAKSVKNESFLANAYDFHVVFDSAASSLEEIRSHLEQTASTGNPPVTRQERLWFGPYLALSEGEQVPIGWEKRTSQQLKQRVEALLAKEDGRRVLPNSQMHDVRAVLFQGTAAADAHYSLIRHRYPSLEHHFAFGPGGTSLFESRGAVRAAALLDAMNVADIANAEPW